MGAAREIPKTNPFLKKLFETITGSSLDEEPYVDFVDDLVQILANTDIEKVLENFGKRTRQEDPMVHFYETFLAAYDPKTRERRGVYYTPEPVVQYIVKSVDYILKTRFGLEGGLAHTADIVEYDREEVFLDAQGRPDRSKLLKTVQESRPKVLILDPACGTGTFLYAVMDFIRDEFMKRGDAGLWSAYVRDHLLPRLFGYELLMAPYAMAHFKLGMLLAGYDLPKEKQKQWQYDFEGDERLGIYLTNTLDEAPSEWQKLFGAYRILSEEANAASRVKRDLPIMVVLGNPPYAGHSSNSSWTIAKGKKKLNFIGELIKDYYYLDGRPIKEHNPKYLQDDYVKFIRWSQWRINKTGTGILAFITNHGYLDNPTFCGMRQNLMNTFSDIYIYDLHGNAKKKEKASDGSKDENVFDIQQGVSIGIFIKKYKNIAGCKVYHSEIFGPRLDKYNILKSNDISSTNWIELNPVAPFYLFKRMETALHFEYEAYSKLFDVFTLTSTGVKTHRDHFSISLDRDSLGARYKDFVNENISDEVIQNSYDLSDTRDWKLSQRRKALRLETDFDRDCKRYTYRPFDIRFIIYNSNVVELAREEVMKHLCIRNNLALGIGRQGSTIGKNDWDIVFVTKNPIDTNIFRRGGVQVFPIYLLTPLSQSTQQHLTKENSFDNENRILNLNPDFVSAFASRLSLKFVSDGHGDLVATFGPEDIFNYIYAIFHSPTYRQRYAEFLKIDFPRVPLTSSQDLFRKLCSLGEELVALHLLESPPLVIG